MTADAKIGKVYREKASGGNRPSCPLPEIARLAR
jgi:hypothetical protein